MADVSKKQQRFWNVGRSTARGKIFWLDIETTGLGKEVTSLGPDHWNQIVSKLDKETTIAGKLNLFKALPEYKFFQDIGLAQFVTASKGRGGAPTWHHGAGYTVWEDSVHNTLMSKRVQMSDFSRIQGIGERSIKAGFEGTASTMPKMLKDFSRKLLQHTASGTSTVRGWNVWFDVWATQAFMAQHAEEMQRAGLDPFSLISATGKGRLRVESMEENYFDLLAWRGLKDDGWAKNNLRYGRMFGAKMGEEAGAAIPIHDYVARRKQGLPNLLRGRAGWKAEKLENIFNEYGALDKGLKSWKMPGATSFDAWSAHDAVRDVAAEYELSRKFRRINKALQTLEGRAAKFGGAFVGVAQEEVLSSLAFARAGILGQDFTGVGMRGHQWRSMVSKSGVSKEILRRSRGIWGAIEAQSPSEYPYMPAGAAERVSTPYGDYFRRIWNKDISGMGGELKLDLANKATRAKNAWTGMGRYGKFAAAGAAAYVLYNALGRQQRTVDSNVADNYISGQQGSKTIDVPWSSPWEGIATDDRTAVGMLVHGSTIAGGAYAFHNLPGIVSRLGSRPDAIEGMVYGARLFEDLMPFRIGRLLNISSYWSSFVTPDQYSIGLKHLAGDSTLTDIGRTYAGVIGKSEGDFLDSINKMKSRGLTALGHSRVSSNSPFMRIDMDDLGEFDIRMFDSTSRLGNTFGAMGSESFQIRNVTETQRAKRAMHILQDQIQVGEMGLGRRALRGLNKLFPNLTTDAVNRWASIPQWDSNPFRSLQRTQEMAGQHLWVPGYGGAAGGARARGGRPFVRAATGIARDMTTSGYNALRQQAAVFGIKMGGARTVRQMAIGAGKIGALTLGGIWAFSKINNSLGGVLTDPVFNMWERAMLARASFSDATGLTSLREQMPDVQTTAALGILGAAGGIGLLHKYKVRSGALLSEARGAMRAGNFASSAWMIDDRGFGTDVREESYRLAKGSASAQAKKFLYRPEMADEWGEMLSAKHYMQWGNLSGRGKVAVGALGALTALAVPFLLGSKYSRDELGEIYSGERNVEVKRGRWWELGSTPYEGGRTHYFRRHQIARRKLRAENQVPGEGHTGLWGMLKSLRDPYWRERESYYDRPYPVTGGTVLGEVPLVGPLLDATLGQFFKPSRYMHREMWSGDQPYEQYGGGLAADPSRGGLSSPTPRDPTGLAAQIREFTYRGTELMGLRGYLTQAIGFQKLFGGDMPFEQAAMLQPARMGPGITDSFWERDMGGMAGLNEIFRRLFPRPERGTEVNPLRNRMPSWLPGENYFVNFKTGDPYSKFRYGGERLPGAGYEALNPEMAGVSPEDYSAFHRYKILADVAPWAAETRTARGAAYAESKGQDSRMEALDRIDREVEQVKKKKNFKEYSFLAGKQTVRGRVSRVGVGGDIQLEDYPNHTFTMAGINTGASAVADQLRRNNNMTKQAATEAAANAAYERQQLLNDLMVGNLVSVTIQSGGMNAPEVAGRFSVMGQNINRLLVDRGLAGNEGGAATAGPLLSLYGRAMEAIGHAPQKVPGPWMAMTKFFNQADPMEEYRRDVLYGSSNRFWDDPYANFVRPYLHQTISKLTPGEYIPQHVEAQREFDVVLDRTKFLKYAQGGELGKARRTMAGGNMYGNADQIQAALPHREKPFFESFRQETDPKARKRILSMVSQDMQRALSGQWSQQYASTQGRSIGKNPDISTAVQMAQQQLKRMGRPVPQQGWAGSDPGVDWDDIKAVMVQNEGADTHDYNIWDDRTQSLLRKPYVYGAVEGLTSRRMQTGITAMSNTIDRTLGIPLMPIETIAHTATVSFSMSNAVNYTDWEKAQYKHHIDRIGEF